MAARLRERYEQEILPELRSEFGYSNVMEVPKLDKIVVNMGVGEAQREPRLLDNALDELALITGQRGSIRRARRSIAGFKVRKGAPIGCMVTLRGERMYEFLDRLCNLVIPRIRDFRGLSVRSFDNQGNYTMAVREQTLFPEIDIDNVPNVRGMNITMVIRNSDTSERSLALLRKLGLPFQS